MNEEVLKAILKKPEKINYTMSSKKAYLIIAGILIFLFAIPAMLFAGYIVRILNLINY